MTGYRAGASATGHAASLAIAVPATVQAGDYVIVVAGFLNTGAGTADVVTATSTGTEPVPLGPTQFAAGSNHTNGRVFGFVATAADAGAVITFTTASGLIYYCGAALAAYSGAAAQPDVYAVPVTGAAVPLASPTAPTFSDGDWAVCLAVTASNSSTTFTSTPYATVREIASTDQAAIVDSAGPVGAAGTVIGAGSWNWAASGYAAAAFTVGLKPAPAPALDGASSFLLDIP